MKEKQSDIKVGWGQWLFRGTASALWSTGSKFESRRNEVILQGLAIRWCEYLFDIKKVNMIEGE